MFGSENVKNVPFLQSEGEFLFSDSEDYSAISVPLSVSEVNGLVGCIGLHYFILCDLFLVMWHEKKYRIDKQLM